MESEVLCVIWVVLAVLAVILLGGWYGYRVAFYEPKKVEDIYLLPSGEQYDAHREHMKNCIDRLAAIPCEHVWIRARDGKRLHGRYYHVKDGAPLQIQFHGYRGGALRDLCGGAPLAMKLGHNVLLVDQRTHGDSEGKTISFGAKERLDCLCWCRYAEERFGPDTPQLLVGVSMGASTVLMASALDLPRSVKGVMADSPYTTAWEIIGQVARDTGKPGGLSVVFCAIGALLYGRFWLGSADALKAVAGANLPLLLIHGEDDRYVPCDMSRRLYSACGGRARLETFPGAAHGMSYMDDPKRYETVVEEFLRECLK